jgi:CheY-like chemotaxis protein
MPKSILVIDDDNSMREIIQASLEITAGLRVILARSSEEGLAKAAIDQPDAILLDLMLPQMDGITVLEMLRANPLTQHIPVVLMTAKVRSLQRRQLAELAVRGTIAKPFKPIKLAEQLQEILGWNR